MVLSPSTIGAGSGLTVFDDGGFTIAVLLILRCRIARCSMVDELAGLVFPRVGPLMLERDDRARLISAVCEAEGASDDVELHLGFVRGTGRIPEREVGEHRTRRVR